MLKIILFGIIVVSLIISIILSAVSSSKAKNHEDQEASDYSFAAMAFAGVAIITLGIFAIQFYKASPSKPASINELVNETTAALNTHVVKIKEHMGVINGALSKMGGVSKGLGETCDEGFLTCKTK